MTEDQLTGNKALLTYSFVGEGYDFNIKNLTPGPL